jgi:hypothetical protein
MIITFSKLNSQVFLPPEPRLGLRLSEQDSSRENAGPNTATIIESDHSSFRGAGNRREVAPQ